MNSEILAMTRKDQRALGALPQWTLPDIRHVTGPVALFLLVATMAAISPGFLSASNFINILSQGTVLYLLALGQMLVIITRGFDISVGAVAALASVVTAQAVAPLGEVNAIIAGVAAACAVGALNGYLITCQGLQPIVVTLGTALVARGVGAGLMENTNVMPLGNDSILITLAYSAFLGLPLLVWIASALALLAWVITKWLPLGRWLYMLGGNPDAATLVGAPVLSAGITAYALSGTFAGLAGMFLLARSGSAFAIEGAGMELQAIAACVIGGIALSGGRGSVWQALVGAFFIQALLNGLNLLGSSPFMSEIVLGAVIVLAGALDYIARKLKK